MNHKMEKRLQGFIFILPTLIMFMIFVAYPFLQGFPVSFTKQDGINPGKTFVGVSNYLRIFKDVSVVNATENILVLTAVTMIFSSLLGPLFALMIFKVSKLSNVLGTYISIPYRLSLVLSSYIWKYVYSDAFYDIFGIPSPLGGTTWIMLGLAVIPVWRDAGYCMAIYIVAIQGVSIDYYEVAELEGATVRQKFKGITFPMIAPAIIANFTLPLAWSMKVFDYPMAAIVGGPGRISGTIAMLIYNNLFTYFRTGYGQTVMVVFTIAIFAIGTIVSRSLGAGEVEV